MNKYSKIAEKYISNIKNESRYRKFIEINSVKGPIYKHNGKNIINWCSNDYNRSIHNLDLINSVNNFIKKNGLGSGGTRNISGTTPQHRRLENRVALLHKKDSSLLFSSGFLANLSTLESLGKIFPNAIIYSDELNHSSIVKGIKLSNCEKVIFPHNDMEYLENKLKISKSKYNIIVVESMYSMDGSITNFHDLIYLKKKYNAFIYIDEIHTVGLYGKNGGGLVEHFNLQPHFDIVMGGFGKGFGTIGGYIAGDKNLIDCIRSTGSGFIFTTSIPPCLAFGTLLSIRNNKKNLNNFKIKRKENILYFKYKINKSKINLIENNFKHSHINSILIGDSNKANKLSEILLNDFNHYVQPINYPTVAKGTERFRICITHDHSLEMIDSLINNLNDLI
jgi:5-aminolevulinate synthase